MNPCEKEFGTVQYMEAKADYFKLIWGVALVLAGAGVFAYVIPRRVPEIIVFRNIAPYSFDMFFIYFCFVLMGILLCIGGAKKIYHYFRTNGET